MWGINSPNCHELRIFRNAFRWKSMKYRCDNYKKYYGFYVRKKSRIRKRLRNIRNFFPIFKIPQIFFFDFQRKKMNWTLFLNFHILKYFTQTSNQLPNSQIWKEPPSTTGELNPGPPAPLTSLFPLDQASFLWKFAKLSNKMKTHKKKDKKHITEYSLSITKYP